MAPLPSPDTVPIQPARALFEKASKAGYTLKFEVVSIPEQEQDFAVHAFINSYLLARCFVPHTEA